MPLWLCLLIPVCIAGVKVAVAADSLRDYEKHGYVRNENNLQKIAWLLTALLLALAYVPPAVGFVLPLWASAALFLVWIPLGLLSLRRVGTFRYYREMNQELLAQIPGQMDKAKAAIKTANEKKISADTSITSQRKASSSSTTCSSSGTGRFCGNPPCASPMSACFSAAAQCFSW